MSNHSPNFNRSFNKEPTKTKLDPGTQHCQVRTSGTVLAEQHLATFRWRRTAWIGVELPGKLMLAPISHTWYPRGSR